MEKELSELTDQELLEKKRTIEARNISNAVILGVLVGIAIYSMITKGLSLMTFIPILFALFVANSWNKNKKELKKELNARNLK
ncbi:FUSC family protein [Chryseobacterium culicis]|uniref:FUSC family protein n=1 Tax=Chryseobacterium culicis TaxID=680127 RepID=A0A2S9CPB2_CHRCI|nr:FUSC family protein [Chryseobacterium culicis]PRB82339.1 FUSC family protein [Chryseobacterium culicis]PRB88714.1 FUSC family protein [Chryseobacterium culicis]